MTRRGSRRGNPTAPSGIVFIDIMGNYVKSEDDLGDIGDSVLGGVQWDGFPPEPEWLPEIPRARRARPGPFGGRAGRS